MASTVSLQNVVDNALDFGDIKPVLTAGGHTTQPALAIANDVMNLMCSDFPYKWNEINLPQFYTNSYQQDYALINSDGSSVTNLAVLQRGIAVDILNPNPNKPVYYVEVNRDMQQDTAWWNSASTGGMGRKLYVNWLPNKLLYYGTWGAANKGTASFGNNPISGSKYTSPLAGGSQPSNPITQIKDANGNLLLLTGYGTEGTTAPIAPANSIPGVTATPGTGATTTWTVLDPNGQGCRIENIPYKTGVQLQFNLVAQAIPVRFTTLDQKLDPIPDDFEPHFRALFIAECYRYSPEEKIRRMYPMMLSNAMASLQKARSKSDRERTEYKFVTAATIGRGPRRGHWGPNWPFNGPPR